jgi:hypothetical protein
MAHHSDELTSCPIVVDRQESMPKCVWRSSRDRPLSREFAFANFYREVCTRELHVERGLEQQQNRDSHEHQSGHSRARLAVYLRNQI